MGLFLVLTDYTENHRLFSVKISEICERNKPDTLISLHSALVIALGSAYTPHSPQRFSIAWN